MATLAELKAIAAQVKPELDRPTLKVPMRKVTDKKLGQGYSIFIPASLSADSVRVKPGETVTDDKGKTKNKGPVVMAVFTAYYADENGKELDDRSVPFTVAPEPGTQAEPSSATGRMPNFNVFLNLA
jgi:hypothetical protein